MLAFSQPSYVLRRAAKAESGFISYLRFASLVCLEMPNQSLETVRTVMGGLPDVDANLIESGRYFVADLRGELVGGAGWSVLPLTYRGEFLRDEDGGPAHLDLGNGAVLLRGFFLDPDLGRRGAGTTLLAHVEADAVREGFRAAEIVAPASSQLYYRSLGFKPVGKLALTLSHGERLPMLQMRKNIAVRLAAAA